LQLCVKKKQTLRSKINKTLRTLRNNFATLR
jgi:hypothetical protein